jgi:hypothetical protein
MQNQITKTLYHQIAQTLHHQITETLQQGMHSDFPVVQQHLFLF